MTDPTPNTNEKIALLKGWLYRKGRGLYVKEWQDPNGVYHIRLPDFEHEWNHNGPLQVEMWEAGFNLAYDEIDGTFHWWRIGGDGADALDDDREDTTDLMLATAMDWLAWKKEENHE